MEVRRVLEEVRERLRKSKAEEVQGILEKALIILKEEEGRISSHS